MKNQHNDYNWLYHAEKEEIERRALLDVVPWFVAFVMALLVGTMLIPVVMPSSDSKPVQLVTQ